MLLEMYRVSGKPIELNILNPTPQHPMGWQRVLEFCHEAQEQGARLHPQFTTNKLEVHLKLADTFIFDEMTAWREVLTQAEPERSRRLADPEWRAKLHAEWDQPESRAVAFDVGDLVVETVTREENAALVGRDVREIAKERGTDPLDTFLDLSLSEQLGMNFRSGIPEIAQQFLHHLVEAGVKDPIVMAGSSDGGAHLASFTGADYPTRLLAEWVPDTISMEDAIWRLSGMPATVHGLKDRGFLRVGAWADIVVFDPASLSASDAYLARDFPAGTERYVSDAEGYGYVIVNGELLLENGKHTGALPGHVLRSA